MPIAAAVDDVVFVLVLDFFMVSAARGNERERGRWGRPPLGTAVLVGIAGECVGELLMEVRRDR
jgi:hypothetical protein